eukprot:m.69029 g.69029  ORF g.69029 m.69029 type:complete len:63 (-) comp8262_c0_seq2:2111-2299(-)
MYACASFHLLFTYETVRENTSRMFECEFVSLFSCLSYANFCIHLISPLRYNCCMCIVWCAQT